MTTTPNSQLDEGSDLVVVPISASVTNTSANIDFPSAYREMVRNADVGRELAEYADETLEWAERALGAAAPFPED